MPEFAPPLGLSVTFTLMFFREFAQLVCLPLPVVVLIAGTLGYCRGRRASSLAEAKWKGFRDGAIPSLLVSMIPTCPVWMGEVDASEAWIYAGLLAVYSVIEILAGSLTGAIAARRRFSSRNLH